MIAVRDIIPPDTPAISFFWLSLGSGSRTSFFFFSLTFLSPNSWNVIYSPQQSFLLSCHDCSFPPASLCNWDISLSSLSLSVGLFCRRRCRCRFRLSCRVFSNQSAHPDLPMYRRPCLPIPQPVRPCASLSCADLLR